MCFLCPWNPQNLSQSFHLRGVKTCFFILSGCPAFTLFNLLQNSIVHSPSSVIRDQRYGNISTCSSSSFWMSMRHAMPSLAIFLLLSTLMSRLYLQLTQSRWSTNSCTFACKVANRMTVTFYKFLNFLFSVSALFLNWRSYNLVTNFTCSLKMASSSQRVIACNEKRAFFMSEQVDFDFK